MKLGIAKMYVNKIAAGAALACVLGFGAVGLGAGVANAAPPASAVGGWEFDGHGGHWGHGGGDWGGDWGGRGGWDNGGNWGYGGWGYGAPCVTGPLGFVTVCA